MKLKSLQINQNLEAMAKQLYDYWFVQFDFPNEGGKPYKSSGGEMEWNEKLKREIPKGWSSSLLSKIADIRNGATPSTAVEDNYGGNIIWITPKDLSDQQSKFVFYGQRNITQKGYDSCSTSMLPKGSVLLSSRAPIGLVAVAMAEVCTNQGFKNIVPNDMILTYFLYYYIKQNVQKIEQLGTGTTFKEVSKDDLKSFPILEIKDRTLLEKWNEKMVAFANQQFLLEKEILELTKQRDELLPLLMNGQVSVTQLNSDLFALYIIEDIINQKTMKESIIQNVVMQMQRELDYRQVAHLKEVLANELQKVEIHEMSNDSYNLKQDNNKLLDTFVSAKKIEGCSDKTLSYYRSTIEHLFESVDIMACHMETSDIRHYLAEYQEKKGSSKVTIDNMRRIFSSFFA